MSTDPPPRWDAAAFAKWLRKWRDAEGFGWTELARRADLNDGTIHALARGASGHREVGTYEPPVLTLIKLAEALDLDLGYVLSKGNAGGDGSRWRNFSATERRELALVIAPAAEHSPFLASLLAELNTYQRENPGNV